MNKHDSKPQVTIHFTEKNPWNYAVVLLHTQEDLPAAMNVHPVFYNPVNTEIKMHQHVSIRKRIISHEPTRKNPCHKHYTTVCLDILIETFQLSNSFYELWQPFEGFFSKWITRM